MTIVHNCLVLASWNPLALWKQSLQTIFPTEETQRLAGTRKLPTWERHEPGGCGIWSLLTTQATSRLLCLRYCGSKANSEPLDGHGVRLSKEGKCLRIYHCQNSVEENYCAVIVYWILPQPLHSRDVSIKVTYAEIVTLYGEWGGGGILIKFSLSKNDKQMWWFTGLVSLWHLCRFWERNRIFRKTQWVSWVSGASELSRLKDLCSLCPCAVTKLPTGKQLQKSGSLKLGNKGSPFCSPLWLPAITQSLWSFWVTLRSLLMRKGKAWKGNSIRQACMATVNWAVSWSNPKSCKEVLLGDNPFLLQV